MGNELNRLIPHTKYKDGVTVVSSYHHSIQKKDQMWFLPLPGIQQLHYIMMDDRHVGTTSLVQHDGVGIVLDIFLFM